MRNPRPNPETRRREAARRLAELMAGAQEERLERIQEERFHSLDLYELLLEEGRVIERGTHEDLMEARGTYYRMVMRQMASAAESGEGVLA